MTPSPVEPAAFWSTLAQRLTSELGAELVAVLGEWTRTAERAGATPEGLESLDELRREVEDVGFLLGCLGAASGHDVLRERREVDLVRRVLLALERPLGACRSLRLVVGGELPRLASASADWPRAVLVAWATWRARGEDTLRVAPRPTPSGLLLAFEHGVAWDEDLAPALPRGLGCRLEAEGLLLEPGVL